MFFLHCIPQILYPESFDKGLIIRAKRFLLRPTIHVTNYTYVTYGRQTDRQTDRQTTIMQ